MKSLVIHFQCTDVYGDIPAIALYPLAPPDGPIRAVITSSGLGVIGSIFQGLTSPSPTVGGVRTGHLELGDPKST